MEYNKYSCFLSKFHWIKKKSYFKWVFFVSLAEFESYQSMDFNSISVEAFSFGNDQYVVFAQPFSGKCSFLEWDHVEMVFRNFDFIESK